MTVQASRITVGELLDKITVQTRVQVSASEEDGAADPLLCVFLRDTPLADVMDALWSLNSYQGETRRWVRSEQQGTYLYTLYRPARTRDFAKRMRDRVQTAYEALIGCKSWRKQTQNPESCLQAMIPICNKIARCGP